MIDRMKATALATVCLCCAIAWGAPAPVTTRATTPTTTRPGSLDTPEAVQRAYRDAVNAQDAAAATALFHARTPGERAMAEIYVANDLAAAQLAATAAETFGVAVVGGGTLLPPPRVTAHEQWVLNGDLATLRPVRRGKIDDRGRPRSPPLRRTRDGFRIDLLAWGLNWMDGPEAAEIRERHRDDHHRFDHQRALVKSGRYRWIDELRDTMGDAPFLDLKPDSPPPKLPRPFRRPVKVDLTSPAATFRTAMEATAEGDGDALLKSYEIVDPGDAATLKALARHITATADLEQAAVSKYGVTGRTVVIPAPLPHPRRDALQMLDDTDLSRIVIKGNEAVLKEMDDDDFGMEFVRVGEQWKLRSRPKAMIGQKQEDPNDWPKIFDLTASLQERFAREITAGKYPSADDARAAMAEAANAARENR